MVSLHLAPLLRPTFNIARCRPQGQLAARYLSSTPCRAREDRETVSDLFGNSDRDADADDDANAPPESYRHFIERIGWEYREAEPLKFLGGSPTPFKMNPSFRPPPPISDRQRESMYRAYMSDPEQNSIRMLSQQYGLSIKRVDAILRLKGLERDWTKHEPLQTGFLAGMEKLLGATTHKATTAIDARFDVHQADILEQDENRDALRQRYQHSYWESIDEGGAEPIVPRSVEHGRDKAIAYAKQGEELKNIPQLLQRVPDTEFMKRPKEKVVIRKREGRPTLQFVDVGTKFMDVSDRVKAIVRSSQRSSRRRASTETRRQAWRAELTSS